MVLLLPAEVTDANANPSPIALPRHIRKQTAAAPNETENRNINPTTPMTRMPAMISSTFRKRWPRIITAPMPVVDATISAMTR